MGELLPCPFCGADGMKVAAATETRPVQCVGCGAEGPRRQDWNRRADLGETVARAWQVAEQARREAAELRADRAQLLESLGQAVHGHSGAGTPRGDLPACEAAGWGMW